MYRWLSKYVSGCVYLRQNIEFRVKYLGEIVSILLAESLSASVCVIDRRFKHYLLCFSALVLLVKGPSVQLTQAGLSLCPLFTVTVIRPMEAQTKGGLFLLSCPGLSVPLWAQTEPRAGGCWRSTGGFDLTNLTEQENECKTMREREKKVRERKRGRCIVITETKTLSSPLSETAVM